MKPHKTAPDTAQGLLMPTDVAASSAPQKIEQGQHGGYVAALAHGARSPLMTINLAVQMLRSPVTAIDRKLYLDIIMRSSATIGDMITQFLRPAHADRAAAEKYPVHTLLDEALAMAEDRILLKNISVRKDYTTLDCKVWADKQQIKIALANIIVNAIEAMPPAKGELRLITRSVNGKCSIEIRDNGIGISQKNLSQIFVPYFTGKASGMGLGLSTAMDILLANHVTTDVRSVEGNGTRFILSFDRIQLSGECLLEN